MKSSIGRAALACILGWAVWFAVAEAGPGDDEEHALSEIVVTGSMRVTAGGAQDINFARGEIERGRIPHPDSMTAEGLMSEHDLLLPAKAPCAKLFCITAEAMDADLPTLPSARYLVGLGFSSNVDPARWQREPINIVAVVDKSGSMSGSPLDLVRRSLLGLIDAMRTGDQLSIVLYGDRSYVHLQPTPIAPSNLGELRRAIAAIESAGSTNMEAGLEVGFAVARQTQPQHAGITRVVLFTDERPNVGRTDAGSFIAMAREASGRGIGTTTIGVGVQFDTKLATALGSTRGGNLFFLDSDEAADTIFSRELDYMVSELAHDVEITLRPDVGYRIAGVYGVPGELMGWQDDTSVTVKIPTVFLSQRGGGIFVSLAPAEALRDLPVRTTTPGSSLMAASASYLPVRATAPQSTSLSVEAPAAVPSTSMALAHLLTDQYLSLRAATSAHYLSSDQETAYRILHGLNSRFEAVRDRDLRRRLDGERELVGRLLDRMAFLSGHGSEHGGDSLSALFGDWRVDELEGDDSLCEVGDILSFDPNNELIVFFVDGDRLEEDSRNDYWATKREILLPDEDLVARYSVDGDRLTLRVRKSEWQDGATVVLSRLEERRAAD